MSCVCASVCACMKANKVTVLYTLVKCRSNNTQSCVPQTPSHSFINKNIPSLSLPLTVNMNKLKMGAVS